MGAWGIGSFENDTALDWAADLAETSDLALIKSALAAERADGYLEADKASEAIAASEVVAAALGGAASDLPESVRDWLSGHSRLNFRDLNRMALTALDQVLADKSELKELWQENDEEFSAWQEGVEALKKRISSAA